MPDVGDMVTATLLVNPFDNTTAATLLVTRPDGTTVSPVATTDDDGNTWTAPLTYTMAGTWFLKWSVTGMGASVEWEEVGVSPDPTYVNPDVRVYATTTELANFLRAAPPPGARGLLEDASRAMARVLIQSVYAVDSLGFPSDLVQREAVRDATCAIVEWWMETGDVLGTSGDWASASAGNVSITRGGGADGKPKSTIVTSRDLPSKAWTALVEAKLLPGVIYQR